MIVPDEFKIYHIKKISYIYQQIKTAAFEKKKFEIFD